MMIAVVYLAATPMVVRLMIAIPFVLMALFVAYKATKALMSGQITTPGGRRHSSSIVYRSEKPGQFWFGVMSCYVPAAVMLTIGVFVAAGGLDALNALNRSEGSRHSPPASTQKTVNRPEPPTTNN